MKPVLAYKIGNLPLGTGKDISSAYGSVSPLISIVLKNSLTIASIILLGLLIFGGFAFIINAGNSDPKKAQQGKSAITNALVGFAIVLLAYFIIQIVQVITGLNILNSNL